MRAARRRLAAPTRAVRPSALRPAIGAAVCCALIAVVAGSCASGSEGKVRAGAVYVGVIRWVAGPVVPDADPLLVFVEPRGEGTSIDIAVQAEVIEGAAEVADVRFIDSRDEALVTDDDGVTVVRDEGVLIRLGPVLEEGRRVSLDVDVFVDEETDQRWNVSLLATGDSWRVLGDPVPYAEG